MANKLQTVRESFFNTVFSLLGHIANCDGFINRNEIKRIELYMEKMDLTENQQLLDAAIPVPLRKGDLLLFHSNLFHAAGRNTTDKTKYSLVFTYRGADNPPLPGKRSSALPDILMD